MKCLGKIATAFVIVAGVLKLKKFYIDRPRYQKERMEADY